MAIRPGSKINIDELTMEDAKKLHEIYGIVIYGDYGTFKVMDQEEDKLPPYNGIERIQ